MKERRKTGFRRCFNSLVPPSPLETVEVQQEGSVEWKNKQIERRRIAKRVTVVKKEK